LTASNPTTCGLAYPEREILAALADPRGLVYRPESKGLREAREAVAEYYAGRAGFPDRPPDRSRTHPARLGTSEAYSHISGCSVKRAMKFWFPRQLSALFVNFCGPRRHSPRFLIRCSTITAGNIDFASCALAPTSRSRAVLVVHPNNPPARSSAARGRGAIGNYARPGESHRGDEVFLDYTSGRPAHTFALSDAALTFTLSGLSKFRLLPRMKLAWDIISGPKPLVLNCCVDRLEIIADTYLSPTRDQLALPKSFQLRHSIAGTIAAENFRNLAVLDNMLRESKSLASTTAKRLVRYLGVPALEPMTTSTVALSNVLCPGPPGHFFIFSREGVLVLSL